MVASVDAYAAGVPQADDITVMALAFGDAATPDVKAGLEERSVGGLGIFMVKKMSKSVAYRREGDRNVLTVVM